MITAPIEIEGTEPDSVAWCHLKDVKEELGIVGTGSDSILTKRIARVSSRLLRFTNLRAVAFARYKETLPGMGDTRLMVTRTPIVNLIEVEVVSADILLEGTDGTEITDEVLVEDPGAGFLYRRFGWSWTALLGSPLGLMLTDQGEPQPGTEEPTYRVDYEAGWLMPMQNLPTKVGADDPDNFPFDLEQACLIQVIWDHRHVGRMSDVKSKKVGDTTITYETSFTNEGDSAMARRFGFCPEAFYLVNQYQRMA